MPENYKKYMSEKVRLLYIWMLQNNRRTDQLSYVYLESLNPLITYCTPSSVGLCRQVVKSL